jgi:hypothetical protein
MTYSVDYVAENISNPDAHSRKDVAHIFDRLKTEKVFNIQRCASHSVYVLGFPSKLTSSEFRSKFRWKLISTFQEIIGRNYHK